MNWKTEKKAYHRGRRKEDDGYGSDINIAERVDSYVCVLDIYTYMMYMQVFRYQVFINSTLWYIYARTSL